MTHFEFVIEEAPTSGELPSTHRVSYWRDGYPVRVVLGTYRTRQQAEDAALEEATVLQRDHRNTVRLPKLELVKAALATVGDLVFCLGAHARVTAVDYFAPGQHPEGCPVFEHLTARRVTTRAGYRWSSVYGDADNGDN
ncbi:hypothetical protein Lfu02_17410 [Longispora fulva]|uniref:Uncharacterized protein n=1 Tax=Longispora fulva TaxID=619741 RepID=A0A8J7GY38_9ACTN|nr:hypothetical protein [Longispora fulva]MBG6140251.1 hypothetical protein [Longispora fulva]GIG57369.1 hypothetical protein Lfu02_17410 [Longispora fulva]